jgi:hypothetical protein
METTEENIHIEYLQEKIKKMEETADNLEKMIKDCDPKQYEMDIQGLKKLRVTTLKAIENSRDRLQSLIDSM